MRVRGGTLGLGRAVLDGGAEVLGLLGVDLAREQGIKYLLHGVVRAGVIFGGSGGRKVLLVRGRLSTLHAYSVMCEHGTGRYAGACGNDTEGILTFVASEPFGSGEGEGAAGGEGVGDGNPMVRAVVEEGGTVTVE